MKLKRIVSDFSYKTELCIKTAKLTSVNLLLISDIYQHYKFLDKCKFISIVKSINPIKALFFYEDSEENQ
jgi:hypothetical protein